MIVAIYSKSRQIQYGAMTPGFSLVYEGSSVIALIKRTNGAINHLMILNAGDKIRMVAKNIDGSLVKTVANTVRLRLKQKL